MVDFYRLPADFPGIAESRAIPDPVKKVEFIEQRFSDDLHHRRFVPYIQLHEFEALLFSDPKKFSGAFPSLGANLERLEAIRRRFQTPEHINEGDDTAPSKRIFSLLPEYVKAVAGPLIAKQIGLAKLREQCHHFNQWLERLEAAQQSE